mmetsp:Transcript_89292/g.255709  ORF Transcript_89292/g.255709 Transcript_89292/m.255709 type:complete len:97 (+) Transcript_89292:829-1119(+)
MDPKGGQEVAATRARSKTFNGIFEYFEMENFEVFAAPSKWHCGAAVVAVIAVEADVPPALGCHCRVSAGSEVLAEHPRRAGTARSLRCRRLLASHS